MSTLRARDLRWASRPSQPPLSPLAGFLASDFAPSLPLALALPDLLPDALWSLTDHLGSLSALAIGSGAEIALEAWKRPFSLATLTFSSARFRLTRPGVAAQYKCYTAYIFHPRLWFSGKIGHCQ